MLIKKLGRRFGKAIKKVTTIPHPIAMRIGKMVAQGKADQEIGDKFPSYCVAHKSSNHLEGDSYHYYLGVTANDLFAVQYPLDSVWSWRNVGNPQSPIVET